MAKDDLKDRAQAEYDRRAHNKLVKRGKAEGKRPSTDTEFFGKGEDELLALGAVKAEKAEVAKAA